MKKLNNKGQALVLFILCLPLFPIFLALVVDIGNLVCEKIKLEHVNQIAIAYALDHYEDKNLKSSVEQLITQNLKKNTEITITFNEDNSIKINIKKQIAPLSSNLIKNLKYEISSTYSGIIENNTKKIERVK